MIYINGIKASKKDLEALKKALAQGKNRATAHTTKKGNFAIVTEFWGGGGQQMRNINTPEELQKLIDEQRNGNTELTPYQAEQIELAKRRLELAEEKERNRQAEQERKRQAAERKERADRNALLFGIVGSLASVILSLIILLWILSKYWPSHTTKAETQTGNRFFIAPNKATETPTNGKRHTATQTATAPPKHRPQNPTQNYFTI